MNSMLKLALGAALAASLALPAMAQENFPDVPANHWAYEALRNLKDKVLFGYPDGLYRGNRPMSRYEFAVAINQLHQLLSGRISALESQVASLDDLIKNQPKGGDTAALQGLRDQLGSLTKRVDGLESGQADLKKLVGEFEKELASLGVDVDALKKDISSLADRVAILEKSKPAVIISGDASILVLGGYSTDGKYGLSQSGEVLGRGRVAPFGPVGADKDLSVLHEAAITLTSANEEGPKFKGTFVVGNMLDTFGSLRGGTPAGTFAEGLSDMYLYELYASFDHSLFGKGFSATVGRFGYKNLEYVLNRSDRTLYFSSPRYDDGRYLIDGAKLSFDLFGGSANVFAGKLNAETMNQMDALTPIAMRLNGTPAFTTPSRILGLDTAHKIGPVDLKIAGQVTDADGQAAGFDRLFSYGAELGAKVGPVTAKGAYAESVFYKGDQVVKTTGTNAYKGELAYSSDKLAITGGWRQVQPFFAAPGAWGRIGTQFSPTGVDGFYGTASYKVTPAASLYVKGQYYKGEPFSGTLGNLGLGTDDHVYSYTVGAAYKVNEYFGLDASYENAEWKFDQVGAKPYQRWFTLGANWAMTSQSSFRLFWQYSDADDKGTNYFTNGLGLGGNRFKGGLIGSQISVKF